MSSALVVIPARYGSSRFPGKALAMLGDKPLIQHVYENSLGSERAEGVLVATDHKEIFDKVNAFGGRAVMTSCSHPSGTDRIAEAAVGLDYDIIVNVQGDEPMMRADLIDSAIALLDDPIADIGTMARKITEPDEAENTNVVKVVFSLQEFALYFSRSRIPFYRDLGEKAEGQATGTYFKHIGIYSYRREALLKLAGLKPTPLELSERLEQLRALENGMRIKVGLTDYDTTGVDTPQDLERVKQWLNLSS